MFWWLGLWALPSIKLFKLENIHNENKYWAYRKKAIMKVMVTGATGFIGKELIKRLNEMGHEIVVFLPNFWKIQWFFGVGLNDTFIKDFRWPKKKSCHFPNFGDLMRRGKWKWLRETYIFSKAYDIPIMGKLSRKREIKAKYFFIPDFFFVPKIRRALWPPISGLRCSIEVSRVLNETFSSRRNLCTKLELWLRSYYSVWHS